MLQKSADARKKLPPLKPILALPTWGQKCFKSEAEPFEIPDFDLGHPVLSNPSNIQKSRLLEIFTTKRKYNLPD